MNPDKLQSGSEVDSQSPPSLDDIVQKLQKTPDIPSAIRQFFGGENIKKVACFFTSADMIDIDALKIAGQLNDEEYIQYMSLMPSVLLIKQNILALAEQLVEAIRPKFRSIAIACVRGDSKNDLISVHNKMAKTVECMANPCGTPFRLTSLREFQGFFLIEFFREMEKIFGEPEFKKYKKIYGNQRKTLFHHWEKATGGTYPPSIYVNERKATELILNHGRFASNLSSAFPPVETNEESIAELEASMEMELAEIRELAEYRKILKITWEHNETKMLVMADDEPFPPKSCFGICFGTILVNPLEELEMPTLTKDTNGTLHAVFTTKDGKINFTINKYDGELVFIALPGITLREFMPREQYLAIKKKVYDLLLSYLRSKDPDVEDLFLKPVKIAEARIESDIIADGVKSDIQVAAPEIELAVEEEGVSVEAPVAVSEMTVLEISDNKKRSLLSRLKGLKGQKVLLALKRLLGDPKRIQGSHVIFESERNGVTRPFPIHFSYDINPFILSSNLQKMGYSLDEFCEIV